MIDVSNLLDLKSSIVSLDITDAYMTVHFTCFAYDAITVKINLQRFASFLHQKKRLVVHVQFSVDADLQCHSSYTGRVQ